MDKKAEIDQIDLTRIQIRQVNSLIGGRMYGQIDRNILQFDGYCRQTKRWRLFDNNLNRQIDRQKDRKKERQIDRSIDRQIEIEIEIEIDRQIDRDRLIDRQIDR